VILSGYSHHFSLSAVVGTCLLLTPSILSGSVSCHETPVVALWLFDEPHYVSMTLLDAGPNYYDLGLDIQHAHLAPGQFGNALFFEADEGVATRWACGSEPKSSRLNPFPYFPRELIEVLAGSDWTWEFWLCLQAPPEKDSVILQMGPPGTEFQNTCLLVPEKSSLSFRMNPPGHDITCPTELSKLTDTLWHHLAFTFEHSTGLMRHFLDGVEQPPCQPGRTNSQTGTQIEMQLASMEAAARNNGYIFSLGRDLEGKRGIHGGIDELRITRGMLYQENFPLPASFSRNYGPQPPPPTKPNGPPLLFGSGNEPGPVRLGSRKHVFIDNSLISTATGAVVKVNPPARIEKVHFTIDQPWESEAGGGPSIHIQSVVDMDDKVCFAYSNGGLWNTQENPIAIAFSEDGLHVEKPDLNLVDFQGSTHNNIVMVYSGQGGIFKDTNPAAPPEELYKFTCFSMERGVILFTSPDCIHWKRNETLMLFSDVGGGVETYWDDQLGCYTSYMRHEGFLRGGRGASGRAAFLARTREIHKHWPFDPLLNPSPNKITEELPIPFIPNDAGQVYRTCAIKYPWAPDTYLAFPWRMIGDHIYMQTELATSRDGAQWKFFGSQPFYFAVSESNPSRALLFQGLIRRGDEIWQYARVDGKDAFLVRLVQGLDRFAGIEAGQENGVVVTRNMTFEGMHLELNFSAPNGHLRVAVLNPDGTEVPGFGLAESDIIRGDEIRHVVSWQGKNDLSAISGYLIRLKIEMANARVFAIQFVK